MLHSWEQSSSGRPAKGGALTLPWGCPDLFPASAPAMCKSERRCLHHCAIQSLPPSSHNHLVLFPSTNKSGKNPCACWMFCHLGGCSCEAVWENEVHSPPASVLQIGTVPRSWSGYWWASPQFLLHYLTLILFAWAFVKVLCELHEEKCHCYSYYLCSKILQQ